MENNRILKHIETGAIDYYYGLKFETNLSFENFVDLVNKKTNLVLDEYFESVKTSFQENLKEATKNIDISEDITIKVLGDVPKKTAKKLDDIHHVIDSIEIEQTDSGLKLYAIPTIQKHIQYLYNRSTAAYEHNNTVYGESYVNSQTRIILPPYAVALNNGESVYIESILYIFRNKSAVLRLTVPLINVDSQLFFENNLDAYISTFEDVCSMNIEPADKSIDSLKECYCSFIVKNNKKIKSVLSAGKIVSIILTKHSAMIKDIKNISKNLQEDIYRILMAPIPNRKNADYLEDAKKCFSDLSFTLSGICSVFSNVNKCVTLIDESMVEAGKEIYKEECVHERLIDDIRNGIEFALCILMLKKINNQYTFYTKGFGIGEERKIQNEYNRDKIFISLLLNETYGSVREQVECFENNMKYFIDTQNSNERLNSINNILEQKNADKIQTLQNVLSIGGLMFSVLFGLPAITDTVSLLRSIFFFIETDVPILTVNNFSFNLWFLINVIIAYFAFFRKSAH